MSRKLTDKQKNSLWQQRLPDNFLASFLLSATLPELGARNPGLPHLRALHRELFQDVLDDAGELRQIDIHIGETLCCHFEYIEKEGNALMQALEEENGLADLPYEELIERLAWYYCELTVLHPFLRGNGRAQRLFFEQLIVHAGWDIQWRLIGRESWQAAIQASLAGDLAPLTAAFGKVVSERDESA